MRLGSKDYRMSRSPHWGLIYAAYQAMTIAAGSMWFYIRMSATGSDRPDLSTGQTVEIGNHGQLLFVESWQITLSIGSFFVSFVVAAVAILWVQTRFGRESLAGTQPLPFAAAVVGAVVFWRFAPQVARLLWA
jgi:hypothetical protein